MGQEVGNIHIGLYVDVGQSRRFTEVANVVEQSSRRMNSALGNTSHAVRALRGQMSQAMQFRIAQNSLRDLTRATDAATQLRTAIVGLTSLTTGSITGAFSAAYLVQMADKARLLSNQIKTVTNSTAEFGAIQDSLFAVSQKTRSSYEATTTLYARMARATDHFNFSQEKLLRTTETIQKAFAIGGASPQEAQGAAIQLSQGIASDRFSGEEFRSVAENAPVLLRGIADALGVNIGKLREMAHAGELTAQVVTEAILKSSDDIDAAFSRMVPTIAQSWTLLNNAILRYTGASDEAYGVTEKIAGAIAGLAENLEDVMYWATRVAGALVALYGARKIVLGVQGQVAGSRATSAGIRQNIDNLVDENVAISKRLVDIEKERAQVTNQVASANARVVTSLQRQVDIAKQAVRTNTLRLIQATPGSKTEAAAMERYSRSVDDLQKKMARLAATPAFTQEGVKIRERMASLDAESAALMERQITNTRQLEAAQKRVNVIRRAGAGLIGAFGGPWGLAVTVGLAAAAALMAKFAANAAASAQETEGITKLLRDMGYLTQEAATAMEGFNESVAGRQISKMQVELDAFKKDLEKTLETLREFDVPSEVGMRTYGDFVPDPTMSTREQEEALTRWLEASRNTAAGVRENLSSIREEMINNKSMSEEARKALEDMALANPEIASITQALIEAGERLNAIAKASKDWGDAIRKAREEANKLPQERYWNTRTQAAENQRKIEEAKNVVVMTMVDEANMNDAEKRIKAIMDQIVKDMEKAGQTLNSAAVRAEAEQIYAAEVTTGAVSGFTDRIIKAESAGKANARPLNRDGSRRSSAYGLGQFIESTWLDLFKRHFPAEAANMTNSQILELRTNTEKSRQLIEAYARENAAILQQAGISVDEVALQLAHFLGPQGAVSVLKAAPGTAVKDVLSAGAIKANPEVLGGGATVDDAIAYAQRRAGVSTPGTQRLDARDAMENALGEQQRMLDALRAEAGIRQSLNPLVNDYGRALSTLETAQRLLSIAQEEGTAAGLELKNVQQLLQGDFSALTPEARAQAEAMLQLAQNMGQATAAGNKLEESQQRVKDRLSESAALGKSVFSGIISDIRNGASASEILVNALNRILDKLVEISLNALFDGPVAGSGGGPLGGLFAGLFRVFGFDEGGFTGPGHKKKPAGVVHAGEFVFDAEATRNAGVENLYRMMEMLKGNTNALGLPGYDRGGLVGRLNAPSFDVGGYANDNSTIRSMSSGLTESADRGVTADVRVYMDDDGKWKAEVERIADKRASTQIGRYDRTQAPQTAVRSVQQYQQRGN
jgi:tape measure domain-containing protein